MTLLLLAPLLVLLPLLLVVPPPLLLPPLPGQQQATQEARQPGAPLVAPG